MNQDRNQNTNRDRKQNIRHKKQTDRIRKIGAVICGLVTLCCAVWLVVYFVQNHLAAAQMEVMKDSYVASEASNGEEKTEEQSDTEASKESEAESLPTSDPEEISADESSAEEEQRAYPGLEGYEVPEKDIDFKALQEEQNEHIYAWITVPGTVIDYPVLQHPEEIGYYLDHNLDHSKGYPGCIYSQLYNSKDWDDPMTVLYGHNMKNGTMFAGLHRFGDSEFFEENRYIYIYTEEKTLVYEIFAAYEYTDMDLTLMYIYSSEADYEEYLDGIYDLGGMNNNFNTEIEVTVQDRILTLCTCISSKPNRRYLVQGVLVAEGSR